MVEGPWPLVVRTRALIIWSATMPGVCVLALLDGQAEARAACSRRHLMDVIIVSGMVSIVDEAVITTIWPEPFMHRWSMRSERQVGLWCSRGFLLHARQLLQ